MSHVSPRRRAAQTRIRHFNAAATEFLSGALLPPSQQQQIAYKKLVARTTKPKTETVHLVPDWMREE